MLVKGKYMIGQVKGENVVICMVTNNVGINFEHNSFKLIYDFNLHMPGHVNMTIKGQYNQIKVKVTSY